MNVYVAMAYAMTIIGPMVWSDPAGPVTLLECKRHLAQFEALQAANGVMLQGKKCDYRGVQI